MQGRRSHAHRRNRRTQHASRKWPQAAKEHGYKYMAITDHSKNLAFANGLDDKRAVEHINRIRDVNDKT